jgi:hypothetical protein
VVVDLISTSEIHVSLAIENALEKRVFARLVKELEKCGTVRHFTLRQRFRSENSDLVFP